MSGKYGTSNAGAESVGVSDCNKIMLGTLGLLEFETHDSGNEVKTSTCVNRDIFGVQRCFSTMLFQYERCVWITVVSTIGIMAPEGYKKLGVEGKHGLRNGCSMECMEKKLEDDAGEILDSVSVIGG
ncbi:hypothetical protein Tco_0009840 [Tanacetum coccineum]